VWAEPQSKCDCGGVWGHVQVDEGWNEHNVVHVKLPGVGGHQDNIVQKVEKIRHWRTEMQLPPRAADLWRAAGSLQLYGDDEENEEVRTRVRVRIRTPDTARVCECEISFGERSTAKAFGW